MVTMTITQQTVTMDGHLEVRVRFEEGKISFDRDYQFYQITSEEMLSKLKEQCRQLAVSLDTAVKNESLVGKSWTYDLGKGEMTAASAEEPIKP